MYKVFGLKSSDFSDLCRKLQNVLNGNENTFSRIESVNTFCDTDGNYCMTLVIITDKTPSKEPLSSSLFPVNTTRHNKVEHNVKSVDKTDISVSESVYKINSNKDNARKRFRLGDDIDE